MSEAASHVLLKHLQEFVASCTWTFAKTYAGTWPHESYRSHTTFVWFHRNGSKLSTASSHGHALGLLGQRHYTPGTVPVEVVWDGGFVVETEWVWQFMQRQRRLQQRHGRQCPRRHHLQQWDTRTPCGPSRRRSKQRRWMDKTGMPGGAQQIN